MSRVYKYVHDIIKQLGLPNYSEEWLSISGKDPILPSAFLIGEAGAAALAVLGHMASELWCLTTNRKQKASIDVRDAALAQCSHQYVRLIGQDIGDLWSPFSGFYQTKDERWVQFHCNFPHHQQGVLDFFACPADQSLLEKAVRQYRGEEIEQQLCQRDLCAALVRTPEEWQRLPQAHAIAHLPLLEIIKIGSSKPKPIPKGARPLDGLRMLELTRVLAGPVCGKLLCSLGASVMRVSSPNLPFIRPLVMDTGFGKLSSFIDLDDAKGKAQLYHLIDSADIFSQSYRPGSLAKKGFSAEVLADRCPGIIYVEFSAYSHQGPWAYRHGYDSLVQSACGIAHEQGNHYKPQHLPAQSLDYLSGYFAAIAVMEALRRRALEGGSYHIRLSLAQTAHWFTGLGRCKENYQACVRPKAEELGDLMIQTNSAFGVIEHLRPALQLSETPLETAQGSFPLGYHLPDWERYAR